MKKQLQEVAPQSARSIAPLPSAQPQPSPERVGAVMSLDELPGDARSLYVEESLERTILQPRVEDTAPATTAFAPAVQATGKRGTKMIATPIDAELRRSVRELRGQYEVSESFVVETALRAFFADRPLADIASDLRARGGRLRRAR